MHSYNSFEGDFLTRLVGFLICLSWISDHCPERPGGHPRPCRLAAGERERLDRWVRKHITGRYGPVRAVEPALVLEVAFDDVRPAPRRKAGLALERPEIRAILWDLPPEAADGLERLAAGRTGQA